MPTPPVDTSLTGYKSGSVDRQDDIYRKRQRPQPYPIVPTDSGYESACQIHGQSLKALPSPSLLGLANLVKSNELLDNNSNFASKTDIDCYQSDSRSISTCRHVPRDQKIMSKAQNKLTCGQSDSVWMSEAFTRVSQHRCQLDQTNRVIVFFFCKVFAVRSQRILVYKNSFPTLELAEDATYKARSSFSKDAVDALISVCNLNVLFVPDLLGRPNYWSPELYSTSDSGGALESIDFFCQQPRFVIHGPGFVQRSPVSIYMRHDAAKNLTYYIISAPESDGGVAAFKSLLNLASQDSPVHSSDRALCQHPLEAHILLSKILFESSQGCINFFRQSMFAQLRAVDELSIQEGNSNRKALADVTIELQIISKDVNKLISDIDVASRNLAKTQEAFVCLDQQPASPVAPNCSTLPLRVFCSAVQNNHRQQLFDTLRYLYASLDKQKMWLYNYRDRKDIAMSLVFNLVTQQDAANNIGIAKEMQRDSSSMNGIALLTMVFLPGTFTSTILGAGIFSAYAQNRAIHVSGLWWFWAAITFPLTGVVLLLWGIFCWRKEIQERWARITDPEVRSRSKGAKGDVEAQG
ncbi:hypothetical protein MMC07_003260 [Pseudocyphellaria aurata]|nr:hypothetical protein [Pseudocyphellaria aurata]